MSLIDIKNLSVTYFLGKSNEVKALAEANLQINAGEFIIFFGSSGCGKSTLLYTIAGLEKPTAGSVMVNDVDLATMKNPELEKYRQHTIGMVFQAFYLIPSLSIVKNIMLPKMAVGAAPKDRRDEAERLMKYFGVYEQRNKLPSELSGGQQQRVAICRALVNNPDIIFADEPVGNLDSKSAQDVLGLIQELNLKSKKTVILVTHDPSHLDVADRVFFMKDGRIIDIKVNKETRKIQPSQNKPVDVTAGKPVLVAHTLDKNAGFGLGGMLLDYKAKEIVTEALTGLTSKEISGIEGYVKDLLQHNLTDSKKLEYYLEKNFEAGGLDLGKRTALRLIQKMKSTAEEMRELGKIYAEENKKQKMSFAKQLRRYLLDTFDVMIGSTDALEAMEQAIDDRVRGITDRKGTQARFDMPIREGGAGLDRRIARKIAKHLELVILGRFNTSQPTTDRYEDYQKRK